MASIKIYKSRLMHAFLLASALTALEMLKFQMFNLKKVYQGHGVQLFQRLHSMTNTKIYKRHFKNFLFSLGCDMLYPKYTEKLTRTWL